MIPDLFFFIPFLTSVTKSCFRVSRPSDSGPNLRWYFILQVKVFHFEFWKLFQFITSNHWHQTVRQRHFRFKKGIFFKLRFLKIFFIIFASCSTDPRENGLAARTSRRFRAIHLRAVRGRESRGDSPQVRITGSRFGARNSAAWRQNPEVVGSYCARSGRNQRGWNHPDVWEDKPLEIQI